MVEQEKYEFVYNFVIKIQSYIEKMGTNSKSDEYLKHVSAMYDYLQFNVRYIDADMLLNFEYNFMCDDKEISDIISCVPNMTQLQCLLVMLYNSSIEMELLFSSDKNKNKNNNCNNIYSMRATIYKLIVNASPTTCEYLNSSSPSDLMYLYRTRSNSNININSSSNSSNICGICL